MRQKGFVWIILPIILVILSVAAFTVYNGRKNDLVHQTEEGVRVDGGKDGKGRAFTKSELSAANAALAKGISIEDPQNDWYKFPTGSIQPDGRPDNSDPYPLPWTDFRSVSVGADANYIYFKFRFWGQFPKEQITYNGDEMGSPGGKITSFTFTNNEGVLDSADLGGGIIYDSDPFIGCGAMISPQGLDETMETIFKIHTSEGMAEGGPGADNIICAFPLKLFNLKLGDSVTFDSSTETGSTKFHHEAMDNLLDVPGSKFGNKVKYILGTDKYEVIENPDYSGHS